MMTPFFRKLGLTTHIIFSVGWLGAVAGFLILAIAGLVSENVLTVRSSYIGAIHFGWINCVGNSGIYHSPFNRHYGRALTNCEATDNLLNCTILNNDI